MSSSNAGISQDLVNVASPDASDRGVDSPFSDIQVELSIIVGKSRPTIAALVSLTEDSILLLDSEISDLVQVYVGDKLIARGELQDGEYKGKSILSVKIKELSPK